jgi:hypothetical protein
MQAFSDPQPSGSRCDRCEHYGLLSRFDWFVKEGAIGAVINGNLVQMMDLIKNPWMANPLRCIKNSA